MDNVFRKGLSLALALSMVLGTGAFAVLANEETPPPENAAESVNGTTLQTAINAAGNGAVLKLDWDVDVAGQPIVIDKGYDLTLDLNGHSIFSTSTGNSAVGTDYATGSMILVKSGSVAITGDGTVTAPSGTNAAAVAVLDGATATIESGSFTGSQYAVYLACDKAENESGNAGKVSTLNIKGGSFRVYEGGDGTLGDLYGRTICSRNIYGAADFNEGRIQINVTGGTFYGFDPSDCRTGAGAAGGANILVQGYKSVETDITEGADSIYGKRYDVKSNVSVVKADGVYTVSADTEVIVPKDIVVSASQGESGSVESIVRLDSGLLAAIRNTNENAREKINSLTVATDVATATFDSSVVKAIAAENGPVIFTVKEQKRKELNQDQQAVDGLYKYLDLTLTNENNKNIDFSKGVITVDVPYQFEKDDTKEYFVYYFTENAYLQQPMAAVRTEKGFSFNVKHFSQFVLSDIKPANDQYQLSVKVRGAGVVDAGGSFQADVYLASLDEGDPKTVDGVEFKVGVGDGLEITDFTVNSSIVASALKTYDKSSAHFAYTNGSIQVGRATEGNNGVLLGTLTVKVNAGTALQKSDIQLTYVAIKTKDQMGGQASSTVSGDTINVMNLTLQLEAGAGAVYLLDADTDAKTPIERLYVSYNAEGGKVYSDEARTKEVKAENLIPEAETGYRVAGGTAEEPLWTIGGETYQTTADLLRIKFTQDTVAVLQKVKTWNVTYDGGAHGALQGETEIRVDTGTQLGNLPEYGVPAVVPEKGWQADGTWTVYGSENELMYRVRMGETGAAMTLVNEDGSESEVTGAYQIKNDVKLIANYETATYSLTIDNDHFKFSPAAVTGEDEAVLDSGIFQTESGSRVTYHQSVRFTIADNPEFNLKWVGYRVGTDGEIKELTPVNGVYTIPGEMVEDAVTIHIESDALTRYTFIIESTDGEAHAKFADGEGQTLDKYYLKGVDALAKPVLVCDPGYELAGWSPSVEGTAGDTVLFRATVRAKTFTVVDAQNVTGKVRNAANNSFTWTYGGDITFNKVQTNGIVLSVTYTVAVGDAVEEKTAKYNSNGTYTIPGEAILGDVTIQADVLNSSFTFITPTEYRALPENSLIAVLKTGKPASGGYSLENYGSMYYSAKYESFVMIIDYKNENFPALAANLGQMLTRSTAQPTEIGYKGDVDGNHELNIIDVSTIYEAISYGTAELSYPMRDRVRLELDVTGDREVTIMDAWVVLQQVMQG